MGAARYKNVWSFLNTFSEWIENICDDTYPDFRNCIEQLHKYIITDLFKEHYEAWLPKRRAIMEKNGQEHNYLFINQDGEPATTSAFRYWMSDWDKVLGGKHWYPHAGRHFWTSYLSGIGLEKQLIEKENCMTVASSIRTIPKAAEKKQENPLLAILSGDVEESSNDDA